VARQTATIKDVAKLAGVSVATVSAVVNERIKKVPLSDKSRHAVLQAIKELNYKVNAQARLLRTGRSYTIGVIASDLTQPFTGESVRLVEQEAAKREYNFLLSDIQNNRERERFYLELFRQKKVEGILFIGASNQRDAEAALSVARSGIPVVMTERESPEYRVPCVLVDNVEGARMATTHLIRQGHRRIAHISGPRGNVVAWQRCRGYFRTLKTHGLLPFRQVEISSGMALEHGYEAMQRLLTHPDSIPTAVFAFNDMIALGAMRAIRESGRRIPDDVALVGYDDIPMAGFSTPTLTTVRQPLLEMCRRGVNLLLDMLEGRLPPGYYERIVLQPELIIRESSGPAPRD